MIMASNGIIPLKEWRHKPEKSNYQGNTVAMLLASNGVEEIPWVWRHKATIKNN